MAQNISMLPYPEGHSGQPFFLAGFNPQSQFGSLRSRAKFPIAPYSDKEEGMKRYGKREIQTPSFANGDYPLFGAPAPKSEDEGKFYPGFFRNLDKVENKSVESGISSSGYPGLDYAVKNVTPPGKENLVRDLKKKGGVNPWAVAWSQYDKEHGK